ncbi:hypothetical protein R3X27_21360 [Tropicimonas sp. TH_r6]|uniref:hypothetical protein n=1 Tax=Tropicimonas sp. TH_r6 TaxID=3082085 RepID=UPI0029553598|nr:hypothetical protein [Tropicimonas sp. TH_r6]MDV7145240.1 hypothetical protein [Tropicimonas sp. TH_r6]
MSPNNSLTDFNEGIAKRVTLLFHRVLRARAQFQDVREGNTLDAIDKSFEFYLNEILALSDDTTDIISAYVPQVETATHWATDIFQLEENCLDENELAQQGLRRLVEMNDTLPRTSLGRDLLESVKDRIGPISDYEITTFADIAL